MLSEAATSDTDLAAGTQLLRGQYEILAPLASGGFGHTYLARDSLHRNVVIKECFAQDYCKREGTSVVAVSNAYAAQFQCILEHFKREAFRLASLNHPRVVGVHQVFEENGTAFFAMDHIQGDDLFSIVEDEPERLDAKTLRHLLVEALEAVQYIHDQGLLHRDLAPDNFILDVASHLTLIDFGTACDATKTTSDTTNKVLAVKDGYSPPELYTNDLQDASSDLYALAATFHFLVTGSSPPDAHSRVSAVRSGDPDPYDLLIAADHAVDETMISLINRGLHLDRTGRIASAKEWLTQLENDTPVAVAREAKRVFRADPINPEEISRLVSAVNKDLTPRSTAKEDAIDAAETEQQNTAPKREKQHFDIFGNPVDDVEAFLREQDDLAKKQARKTKASPKQDTSDPVHAEPEKKRQSALGRLLDKVRSDKRSLTTALPQS